MKVLFMVGISLFSICAFSNEDSISEKIRKLNDLSMSELGISINALSYLRGTHMYSFIPLKHLEESGDINLVRELEAAGLVATSKFKGLPDGTEPDSIQVNVFPLEQGAQIQDSLKGLTTVTVLPRD